MKQKDIFLQSEGDAWLARNQAALAAVRLPDDDPLLRELLEVVSQDAEGGRRWQVLEVGCGDGTRLAWIQDHLPADCRGVEPSAKAAAAACAKGVEVQQGTADVLPCESQSIDVLMFGFCLYLCDREDLFRIASEADRVLRSPGWLLILDFFSPVPMSNAYHHRPAVKSYKMDYRRLFDWHPHYTCLTHKIRHHGTGRYTDDPNEWVGVSVLRKQRPNSGA